MAFKRSAVRSRLSPPPSPENQWFSGLGGGDKRDRTADLLNAIQALSQLSYTPIFDLLLDSFRIIATTWGFVKGKFDILQYFLDGFHGSDQCGHGVLQGQGRCALFGKLRDMDESHLDRCSGVVMQKSIKGIIAYKCACGVGNAAGDAGCANGRYHIC